MKNEIQKLKKSGNICSKKKARKILTELWYLVVLLVWQLSEYANNVQYVENSCNLWGNRQPMWELSTPTTTTS